MSHVTDVMLHVTDVMSQAIVVMLRVTLVSVYVKGDIQHFISNTHGMQPCTNNKQHACREF